MTVHCPGQPERAHYLTLGTYILRVGPSCQISGEEWTLTGIQHFNSTPHQILFYNEFNLDLPSLVTQEVVQTHL